MFETDNVLDVEKIEKTNKERKLARNTLIFYFLWIPLQFIVTPLVFLMMKIELDTEKMTPEMVNGMIIANFICYIYILVSVVAYSIYFLKTDFKKIKPNIKKILIWFFSVFVGLTIINISLTLIQQALHIDVNSENQEMINKMIKGSDIVMNILNFIPIVIIAPLCEELVFRKAIFQLILKDGSKKRGAIAITVSTISFALIHLITELFQITQYSFAEIFFIFAPYFIMAFGLSLLYYKTDNIYTTIGIHFLNNLISFILIFV